MSHWPLAALPPLKHSGRAIRSRPPGRPRNAMLKMWSVDTSTALSQSLESFGQNDVRRFHMQLPRLLACHIGAALFVGPSPLFQGSKQI